MRILITNDDGINAPGLQILTAIATELAGPEGEVWTVAPAFEQSGVAHCISYVHPTLIAQMGPRRYAAEGSPADCVLAGLHDVLVDTSPDLILSGVNKGNNSAENALYSGTLGAAMEGALQGVPSVALSQFLGPKTDGLANPFEAAERFGVEVLRRILALPNAFGTGPYLSFYNVNFPPFPADQVTGIRPAAQGFREGTSGFKLRAETAPNGRRFLWVAGVPQDRQSGPGTDASANLEGYISVTPMRADLTAHDQLAALQGVWD